MTLTAGLHIQAAKAIEMCRLIDIDAMHVPQAADHRLGRTFSSSRLSHEVAAIYTKRYLKYRLQLDS